MHYYRQNMTALVRMTLHAEDFEPWPGILERFPRWTAEHIRVLETVARRKGETDFSRWRARAEPLPLSRVINIEIKPYTGAWQTIDPSTACVRGGNADVRGTLLGDVVYSSIQYIKPGRTSYDAAKIPLRQWEAAS